MFSQSYHGYATETFKLRSEDAKCTLPLHELNLTGTDRRINFAQILGLCSRHYVLPADVFCKVTSHCLEFRVTPRVCFLCYPLRVAPPSVLSDRACALTLSDIFWKEGHFHLLYIYLAKCPKNRSHNHQNSTYKELENWQNLGMVSLCVIRIELYNFKFN